MLIDLATNVGAFCFLVWVILQGILILSFTIWFARRWINLGKTYRMPKIGKPRKINVPKPKDNSFKRDW